MYRLLIGFQEKGRTWWGCRWGARRDGVFACRCALGTHHSGFSVKFLSHSGLNLPSWLNLNFLLQPKYVFSHAYTLLIYSSSFSPPHLPFAQTPPQHLLAVGTEASCSTFPNLKLPHTENEDNVKAHGTSVDEMKKKHRVPHVHKGRNANPDLRVQSGWGLGKWGNTEVVTSLLSTFTHRHLFLRLIEDSPFLLSSDLFSTLTWKIERSF